MATPSWQLACPIEITSSSERITLAHGEGGRQMRELLERSILPHLSEDDRLALGGDSAVLSPAEGALAFTTDSYVVTPLFFPGGDIGRLAVFGTVNDLVVAGAEPLAISLSLILEEGLPTEILQHVMRSAGAAAREAGVDVVTGDTKVVPRGAVDGLFLNTSGVGRFPDQPPPGPAALEVGDELVVSGPVGRHGIAILTAREQLGFDPPPETDCACLLEPVRRLRDAGLLSGPDCAVVAMRDATRGGVAAVFHEWALASGHTLTINEAAVPVTPEVRGASELLGLDPLQIACEGTMLIATRNGLGERTAAVLRGCHVSSRATLIGEARDRTVCPVTVCRVLGRELPLDEATEGLLPRIC